MRQADGVAAASLLLLLLPCILAQQITSTISIPYCSTSPGLFTIYGSMTSAIPSNILSSNSQTPTAGLLSSSVSSVATPLASAYVDQYGGKYTVQFDTGLVGSTIPASRIDGLRKRQAIDIGTLDQTFEDCLESCTLTSACVAVAALDSTCQLFSSVRETVSLVGGKVAFNQERFLGFSNGTILPSSMATEASSAQGMASASAISSGGFRSSMPGLASMPGGSMTPLSQLPSTLAMETSTAGPLVSSFVTQDISPAGSSSDIMPSAALSTNTVTTILSSGAVLSATSEPLSTFSSAGDPTITLQVPSSLSTESSVSISSTSSTPTDQLVSTMTSDGEISYSTDLTITSSLSSLATPASASISSAASSSLALSSVASVSSSRSRAESSSSSSSPGPINASTFFSSPAVPTTTRTTTTTTSSSSSSSSPATPTSSRKPPTCPDDDGEDYIDTNGFIYIITCDIGFNDETIQTTTVQNFVDCITTCDAFNELPKDDEEVMGCGGVNFNSLAQTDNCLLMPGAEIAEMAGIWSAQLSGSIAE
ncbi:uncharacterized protein SEPMUDRAFT_118422 [Sphaerulina musiva SO2202]|uniref:PAN-3 domain-containing protein n=1 Tax=Sphaerulina musiva (strain SO2202) TaxID=692275 RepID=M3AWI9_SPHMS|nr:uncharacterized protein SEPMUDRAFT_118422 [Sphaerulina musiva SO2202]EMF11115.1 hypothetical protein SEPMUDRAFT_118422 [Sphaerulina musiva SO2202]